MLGLITVLQKDIKNTLKKFKDKGARLITATAYKSKDKFFILYHLDLKNKEIDIKTHLKNKKAKSITDIFKNAVMYEKEITELFGIDFGKSYTRLFLPSTVKPPFGDTNA